MARVETQNYKAEPDTMFAWATTDNDIFNREKDLYRLALALERHDHSRPPGQTVGAGRGAPLGPNAVSSQSVTNAMLATGAVTTDKIQDGTIKGSDIENGTIPDTKFTRKYLPIRPDTNVDALQNDLRIARDYNPAQGALFFGTGNTYWSFDGNNIFINNAANGYLQVTGSAVLFRGPPATPNTLYLYIGAAVFFYTTGLTLQSNVPLYVNNDRVLTTADLGGGSAVVGVPLGGICMFRAQAEITAAGANWEHDVSSAGRLLIGAGSISMPGQPGGGFAPHTGYGTTWIPTSGLGVDATGVSAIANAPVGNPAAVNNTAAQAQVSNTGHTHAVTFSGTYLIAGKDTPWIPPSYATLFGRRRA